MGSTMEGTVLESSVEHYQERNSLEDKCHVVLQNLNEQTTNLHDHFLIKKVQQWKEESINKIEKAAEEAIELLEKYLKQHNEKTEIALNELIEKTKNTQEENNLNEIIFNQLKDKLEKLEKEFIKPSNISIQQDYSTFIQKIFIIESSKRFHIASNSKWNQDGITVAGGFGAGSEFNQLRGPCSIDIDDNQTIYVADTSNRRVVKWKNGAKSGEVIAGPDGIENQSYGINEPSAVIFDKENDSLIISYRNIRRVIRCFHRNYGSNRETIIANVDCYSLAKDNKGYIYGSDFYKNEVRRWKIGESDGIIVAGGNGQGDGLNQLNSPYYIYVDDDYSVYISDQSNHRVVKWIQGAKEGIIVAGGEGQGHNLNQLSNPRGVFVDKLGTVYVADCGNDRIMRWMKGDKQGSVIVGGNGSGDKPNQLHDPVYLSFDRENNLYVVDYRNHRIQKFIIETDSS